MNVVSGMAERFLCG